MKHVLVWADDSEAELHSELHALYPEAPITRHQAALLELDVTLPGLENYPQIAFARQFLPEANPAKADSIQNWARLLVERLVSTLQDGASWVLHIEPHYGETASHRIGARAWHTLRKGKRSTETHQEGSAPTVDSQAGRRRCDLIRQATLELLRKTRRSLLTGLREHPATFTDNDSLVQLLLTSPESGFLSIARAPVPYVARHVLSPFPLGRADSFHDPQAPSRAFAKLAESELRLGENISAGHLCVDLGAAPGSWTYWALSRGARVIAVDRSELRPDLMQSRRVEFLPQDAFAFQPKRPVDWLLCDVITEPARTADLLLRWLSNGWCKRFVVTLKLKGGPAIETLAALKAEVPRFSQSWIMKKLTANKKEVCIFGLADSNGSADADTKKLAAKAAPLP